MPALHRHYRIIDTDFRIGLSSPELARPLDHILSGFHTSPTQSALHYALTLAADGTVRVSPPDGIAQTYPSIDHLLPKLEIELIHCAIAAMPYLGIHAGVIAWDGFPVLLPGASGSGKTTLALGCALNGAQFLSDEIAIVHPQTGFVRPFPRTLCIKNQTLPIFAPVDLHGRLNTADAVQKVARTQCLRTDLLDCFPVDSWTAVQTIAFPTFDPQNETHLSSIAKAEAIGRLMKLTLNRHRFPTQTFETMAKLASSVPCYTLTTGDIHQAVVQIQNMCCTAPCPACSQ